MKRRKVIAMFVAMAVAGSMAGCGSTVEKAEVLDGIMASVILEYPEVVVDVEEPEVVEVTGMVMGVAEAFEAMEVPVEAVAEIPEGAVVGDSSGAVQADAGNGAADSGGKPANTSGTSSGNGSGSSGNSSGSSGNGSGSSGNGSGSSGNGSGSSGNGSGSSGNGSGSSGNGSGSSGNGSGSSGNGSGNSGGKSVPAHEHVWKEHTASRQEWVSKMVTVDDYETQSVQVGDGYQCNCGYRSGPEGIPEEHVMAHIMAGEPDNQWCLTKWVEQKVKVGSHQEDQGHYETVAYVDYYYCDCGATK